MAVTRRLLSHGEVIRAWQENSTLRGIARALEITPPTARAALIRAGLRPPGALHSPDPRLLTCVDAAILLGVTEARVHQRRRAGDLTGHTHPAHPNILYDRADIEALRHTPRRAPQPPPTTPPPPEPNAPDGLISPTHAAYQVRRSITTIHAWLSRGHLTAHHHAGRTWIHPTEVAEVATARNIHTPPQPGLITVTQAAQRLGCTPARIYEWIAAGWLPTHRPHHRHWIDPTDLHTAAHHTHTPHHHETSHQRQPPTAQEQPPHTTPTPTPDTTPAPTQQRPPGMLTITETAHRLGTTETHIHQAIRTNRIHTSRDMRTGHYWIPEHTLNNHTT